MKKLFLAFLALSSLPALASEETIIMCSKPSQEPYQSVYVPMGIDSDGATCKHAFDFRTGQVTGDCFVSANPEKIINIYTDVIVFNGMGTQILNVPSDFRQLDSFQAVYWFGNTNIPDINSPIKGQTGNYKVLDCQKMVVNY